MDKVKQDIARFVDDHASTLLEVSHAIHANPELAFKEYAASATLTRALENHKLQVKSNVYGLETAFEAEITGDRGPGIDILAEYDALPGIGHACGHNIIATSALGAFLALKSVNGSLGGSVRMLGTPAEERGGGKEVMARNGAFDNTDAAIMMHPSGINLATMPCICVAEVRAVYQGKSAHASAMPHRGVNALDGLLLAYQAISNLRQHIQHTERIHGIITEGGQAPNIVPDRASGEFYVRAANANELEALKPRVQACFEAGARASGSEVETIWGEVDYLDLNTNWPLAESFQRNAEALGRDFFPHEKLGSSGAGSTDMGNVSHRVPSIHPMLAAAPANVVIHNPEFEKWAGSEMGDRAALDGAKALAMTALDFLDDPSLQQASKKAFDVSKGLA
ncbi:MAG: M20 family metallopeptidase [Pseudomonadota bacterium]|nr:M20 family metallopeptidase [Pseudomonadota bacterium]